MLGSKCFYEQQTPPDINLIVQVDILSRQLFEGPRRTVGMVCHQDIKVPQGSRGCGNDQAPLFYLDGSGLMVTLPRARTCILSS